MSKTSERVDEFIAEDQRKMVELDELAEKEEALRKLKACLPMLYTARGNVIKQKPPRITGKNFAAINHQIEQLNFLRGASLTIRSDDYELTLTANISDALRDHKQIEHLVLAGWNIYC